MPPKKPTAVVVIAVLQLVFGIASLCGPILQLTGAQQAVSAAFQVPPAPGQPKVPTQADIEDRLAQKVPNYPAIEKGGVVVDLVLCLLMIGSGIGLLQLRGWGRRLAIVYAVLTILDRIAGVVIAAVFVLPVMSDVFKDLMADARPEVQAMVPLMQVTVVLALVATALIVIYPIIVLIVLMRPSVRAAFGAAALPEEPEDYRDPVPPQGLTGPDDRFRAGGP